VIDLCAITTAPAPEAAGLRAIEADGLAALGAPAVEREASVDQLWQREQLLERLMRDCDLLPVRWGTVVEDDEVERLLASRRAELVHALDRVRGAVEIAVRVATDEQAVTSTAQLYLHVKRRLAEIHAALAALSRESAEIAAGRSAYLVAREDVDSFVSTVAALEEAHDDLSILCTGPWPPYSFVGT
jgi:Gas vesicle synthesis protein GvpL/GvpF